IGKRSIIGINLRMNELTGAFALGQLKKLDTILELLTKKKKIFKKAIMDGGIKSLSFRKINDPEECHTVITIMFPNKEVAFSVAETLNSRIVSNSDWHVYNNMEQLLSYTDNDGVRPFKRNMLPKTDEILERSINLSVGVVDPGLGTGFGINILSSEKEIHDKADQFIKVVNKEIN
ncbi:MAG: DegT/DnrJ/EryC1/StrS family aminotransferase, partial [Candidatus Heimdallarchaeota archaeon]|nr:DegT/DnrJ/EryC1/StrS family aminotransferase [Candidatus Heimdallarchaeota archaeon]